MSWSFQFALINLWLICAAVFGPISYIFKKLPMKICRDNVIEENKVIPENRRKIGLRVGILFVYPGSIS
jgi:hypothetical protein